MKNFTLACVIIIISGICAYFSGGFNTIWWTIYIVPLPILIYGYYKNISVTIAVSFLASFGFGLNGLIGYWPTQLPISNSILGGIVKSAEFTFVVILSCYFMRRIKTALNIFIYPVVLTLIEWFASLSAQGTFDTIAYSQLNILPMIQIASITGYLGISFIISLFTSSIVYFIICCKEMRNPWGGLILGLAIVSLSLGYGFYRLNSFKTKPILSTIKVGLVSVSRAPKQIFNPELAKGIFSKYASLMVNLVEQGVSLIVLPEEVFSVTPQTVTEYKQLFSTFAKDNHVRIIVGIHEQKAQRTYNTAWVYDNQGNWLGEYNKRHFVPQVEDGLTPGTNLLPFKIEEVDSGVAICRDMDYINPAQSYGKIATQVLFVPAWDFNFDAYSHAQGAWMRGVENGYTLVRVARDGFLSVSAPTGKIMAQKTAFSSNGSWLVADVSIYNNQSFYAKHPLWFVAVLWLLFSIIVLTALL